MRCTSPILICLALAFLLCTELQGQNDVDYTMQFSTYLGGSGYELNGGLAIDSQGNVYIAGTTTSPDFPVFNSAQQFKGGPFPGSDGFITILNSNGQISYSTFIGGSGNDLVRCLAADSQGRVYIAGATTANDFPMIGSFQDYVGGPMFGSDAFVARLDPATGQIDFGTYLGGSGEETINGIALDTAGSIYVVGTTNSFDFPTTAGAFQPAFSGRGAQGTDVFVAKISWSGEAYQLDYSTLLGGHHDEHGAAIVADDLGRCYLTGYTNSSNFPIRDAIQNDLRSPIFGNDAFITALSSDGSSLYFSTYLGGSEHDTGEGIVLNSDGSILVTGSTASGDLSTTADGLQMTSGGMFDAFVALISHDNQNWETEFMTYLGGEGQESVHNSGSSGGHVIAGVSTSFSLQEAYQLVEFGDGGQHDAFIFDIAKDGQSATYQCALGGLGDEAMLQVAGGSQDLVLTGTTTSDDFPLLNPFQDTLAWDHLGAPRADLFVTSFSRDKSTSIEKPQHGTLVLGIHPNPVKSTAQVLVSNIVTGTGTIEIFDHLGRVVYAQQPRYLPAGRHTFDLDCAHLPEGMYICRLTLAGEQAHQKFTVQTNDKP